ncbi:hypothetical protein RCH06_002491 [Polaromonas sp. CG_9.5]|uniref:GIY-YIG nuclease family protein n=1 Tax=Polaromonas sp. CG_9.5 TaxID=3071705 RepID=UPI002E052753|nr:hypothetical protein [Polaromonas sp. CG_9.5]
MAKQPSIFSTKKRRPPKTDNGVWTQIQNRFARPIELKAKEQRSKIISKEIAAFKKTQVLSSVNEVMQKYGKDEKQARSITGSVRRQLVKEEQASADRRRLLASFQTPNLIESNVSSKTFNSPIAAKGIIADPIQSSTKVPAILSASDDLQIAKIALQKIRLQHGAEIRQRGEQTSIQEGFIYLVSHPLFHGWVKGGMTVDFELRLEMYNVADPLSRFSLSKVKWAAYRRTAEKELLDRLANIAQERRGEWFRIEFEQACNAFHSIKNQFLIL